MAQAFSQGVSFSIRREQMRLAADESSHVSAECTHKGMPSEQSMSNITCVIPHATPRTAMRHLCAMHLIVVYMGSVGEEELQAW